MSDLPPTGFSEPVPPEPPAEVTIARIRPAGRHLVWSALILIALVGASGYFFGNLPDPLTNWMLVVAAGAAALLFVVAPYARWRSRRATITSRRMITTSGVFSRERREFSHTRGYGIRERRSLWQRMNGTGTLILDDGITAPLTLRNVPSVALVREVLAEQIERNQSRPV